MRCLVAVVLSGCSVANVPRRPNHPYLEGFGWYGTGHTSTTAGRVSAGYAGAVCSCLGAFELRGGAVAETGGRERPDGSSSFSEAGGELEADADLSPDVRIGPRVSMGVGVAPETGYVVTAGVHLRSDHFDLGAELMHDTGADRIPSTTEVGLGLGVSANSTASVVGGALLSLLAVAVLSSVAHDN